MVAADLSGKTAVITGASSGLGRACAFALAGAGAELVLICRNRELAQNTVADIKRATGNQQVDYLLADLSSQAEVRAVAAEFLASGRPLHILLNNAGALFPRRTLSADGIEKTFALNHLGYFLLTALLLERIKDSAPARIVNVASRAHEGARQGMCFDDLQGERDYSSFGAYGQSKLANILFTQPHAHLFMCLAGGGRGIGGIFRRLPQHHAESARAGRCGRAASVGHQRGHGGRGAVTARRPARPFIQLRTG